LMVEEIQVDYKRSPLPIRMLKWVRNLVTVILTVLFILDV